jgi:diguanylate cyclase (GGDEF)-like protein/PAS domain S-box-containing protein
MVEVPRAAGSHQGGFVPSDPAFYRAVLERVPHPILVIDERGRVAYGNPSLEALLGWKLEEGAGHSIIDFLHTDDIGWVVDSFLTLAGQPSDGTDHGDRPWAAIHFRLIAADGSTVPVEVAGRRLLGGPGGHVVYDVRPASDIELLRRVLSGVAFGEPVEHLLDIVVQMLALPPVELHAVALERTESGEYRIVASSSPELARAIVGALDPMPWQGDSVEPVFVAVADIDGPTGDALRAIGMVDAWYVSVASPDGSYDLRLIELAPLHHIPANGPVQRLIRARELAAVVLLRAHNDRLMHHAADHDSLTQLANRRGFYRGFETSSRAEACRSVLFVDLDGFKPVNDRCGHSVGDSVLQEIANRLRAVTRNDDVVSRIGGDEFAIALAPSASAEAAEQRAVAIADRIQRAIGEVIQIGEFVVSLSASIGVVISSATESPDRVLAAADAAMYDAKRSGGAQHRVINV